MAERKIYRSINFILEKGKALSSGVDFSNEPQHCFTMNPYDFGYSDPPNVRHKGYGHNWCGEIGVRPSQYSVKLLGRELLELFVTYKLDSLPEASIPTLGEDATDTQLIAEKRDWIWKESRKELDVLTVNFEKSLQPLMYGGELLSEDSIDLESVRVTSFNGTISMRGIKPFYRQELTPMLPTIWGALESPALAIRHTPWGNLTDKDSVNVGGAYYDIVEVLPKRALGIIL